MIVVTAPTGNIGRQVLDHLVDGAEPVRVIVRDPSRLADGLADRVEVVPGSHGDPTVLDRALTGADALFWLVPPDRAAASVDDAYRGFTRPAADAVARHGVRRVVDVSALGRATPYADRAGHVTASLAMDDLLAATGAHLRVLACATFMDNALRQVPALVSDGMYLDAVAPDRPLRFVATRDIAAMAARLLGDTSWSGQAEVPLLGPQELTMSEFVETMTDVLARPVRYRQVPAVSVHEQMTAAGASAAMARAMVDMAVAKDNGLDDGVARSAQHALDTPTTFRQWCTDVLRPAVDAATTSVAGR